MPILINSDKIEWLGFSVASCHTKGIIRIKSKDFNSGKYCTPKWFKGGLGQHSMGIIVSTNRIENGHVTQW